MLAGVDVHMERYCNHPAMHIEHPMGVDVNECS